MASNAKIMDDDILTIEEVANFIRVSSRTVYDWAQKGEIPAGKIGTVWRFKKSQITKWLDERLSPAQKLQENQNSINIKDVISVLRIVFLSKTSRKDALIEVSSNLATAPQVKNAQELEKEILKREELMSTAIGRGIAIPHVRLSSVTDLVVSIGISDTDIEGFGPLDDIPVRLLIMIAASYNQHAYYLQALSYFSSKLKDNNLRNNIIEAKDAQTVYDLLTK